MNYFPSQSQNSKIRINQTPLSVKTATTPHNSQNNNNDKQNHLLIKVQLLEQLIYQLKCDQVQCEQVLRILRQASNILKKNQPTYRKMQMAKQIANLNKIKEENQRILHRRIKQLQQKLKRLGHDERSSFQKFTQNTQITVKIAQKDAEIGKLNQQIRKLTEQIRSKQQAKSQLYFQNVKLRQIISKQQVLISDSTNNKQVKQNPLVSRSVQTQNFQGQPYFSPKICQIYSLTIFPQQRQKLTNNQGNQALKYILLQQQFQALQTSNSTLRSQLLKLQDYMQQQDEKYQKNISYLQSKIKALTQFNYRPRDSPLNTSRASFNNSARLSNHQRTHRNSDLSTSFKNSRKQSFQNSRIIQLADFKIKFQLDKHDEDMAQTKLCSEDSKLTITSTQKYQ